jgi:hypothetical protein
MIAISKEFENALYQDYVNYRYRVSIYGENVARNCQITVTSELGEFKKERMVDGRIRNNWGWSSFRYGNENVNEIIILDWFYEIDIEKIVIYAYTENNIVLYFPKDFIIEYWDNSYRQWISILGKKDYISEKENVFLLSFRSSKIRIQCQRTSGNTEYYVRFGEIEVYSKTIDISDRITDIFLQRQLRNNIETSSCRCSVENIENIFNPENIEGGLFPYPFRFGRIRLEIGVENYFLPIFTGFLAEPIRQEIEAYIQAIDWWMKFRKISAEKIKTKGDWYREKTLDFLIRELVIEGGISEKDIIIHPDAKTIRVSEADFSNMNIATAIEEITEYADFQAGFCSDGKFYFRPIPKADKIQYFLKNELGGRKNIIGIKNAQSGWDDVYNIIRLERKDIEDIIFSSNIFPRPNSFDRYGERELRIQNRFLEKASYMYVEEVLKKKLAQLEEARKSWHTQTIILPHLEVGDILEVSAPESEYYPKGWDISRWDIDTWDDMPSLFIWETVGQITNISYDLSSWTQEIQFQEVL